MGDIEHQRCESEVLSVYSISLNVLLVTPSRESYEKVKEELSASPVSLAWKRTIDEALVGLNLFSADAVLLEGDDLSAIAELRGTAPRVPLVFLHSQLDQQLGLAAIREGASEYLAISEVGHGGLFRAVRYCVERAKVERALEASRSQLLTSQKMEAIGRTVAGVAHDFRHFLQVIYGNCGLMKRLNSDPTIDEMIDEIRSAGDKANTTIKHLLNFAQGSPIRERVMDLNKVITDLQSLCQALLQRGLTIHYHLCPQPLLVRLDSRVEQVLMNLAVNAADAISQETGKIIMETRLLNLDRPYVSSEVQLHPGNYAVIEVSDTGVGIDPAIMDRIFEPFFTTKPRGIGTGIGLSVVFTLVQDWKGKVVVASEPGVGTTFKIILPCEPLASGPSVSKTLALRVNLRRDEGALQLLLRKDFSALGCEVSEVDDQEPTIRLETESELSGQGLLVSGLSPKLLMCKGSVNDESLVLRTPFSRSELGRGVRRLVGERND
jgi:signal transduction histidine kinase